MGSIARSVDKANEIRVDSDSSQEHRIKMEEAVQTAVEELYIGYMNLRVKHTTLSKR